MHEYIEELKRDVPDIIRYNSPEDTVLAVAALLQEKLPSKGTYLSAEYSSCFEDNWNDVKRGIRKAVSFLSDEKIYDYRRLPSDVVVYVISAIWAKTPDGLDKEGEVRSTIRKYMWRSFFTERYDRSTNSRAFSDYRQIRSYIANLEKMPEIFDEDIYPVASTEDLLTAGWPYRKDRLARAILSVTLKSGGFDFADGSPASYQSIQQREYHHIFPQAWLKDQGKKEYQINRALNCALISWKTNRNISAKSPSEYVLERMEKSSLGEPEVKRRLESHLIPVEPLKNDDYDAFVENRAKMIKRVADKLCNGEIVESML